MEIDVDWLVYLGLDQCLVEPVLEVDDLRAVPEGFVIVPSSSPAVIHQVILVVVVAPAVAVSTDAARKLPQLHATGSISSSFVGGCSPGRCRALDGVDLCC